MNRAKISASILVIVAAIATLAPIYILSNGFHPISSTEELPSWVITDTISKKLLTVYQTDRNTTAVDAIESWYLIFIKLTYNASSMNITSEVVDMWRLNSTSSSLTETLNATSALNYALGNCDSYDNTVKVAAGNYTINSTLFVGNNTSLYGEGSFLTASEGFNGSSVFYLDGTRFELSNIHVDMTHTNWNGTGYSFPHIK